MQKSVARALFESDRLADLYCVMVDFGLVPEPTPEFPNDKEALYLVADNIDAFITKVQFIGGLINRALTGE